MKTLLLFLSLSFCLQPVVKAQLNVELLHQLVEHSKQEYDKQQSLRNTQVITTTNQEINGQQTATLKSRYREITQRFQVLGTVLLSLTTSLESSQLVDQIIQEQTRIFQYVKDDPSKIILATNSQGELINRAQQLAKYILGLMLSIGEINQMKQSDRRILYGHVITELRNILSISRSLANSMYYASVIKKLKSQGAFSDFINEDKRIVESILSKIKILTP
jgi:hypothetical protein